MNYGKMIVKLFYLYIVSKVGFVSQEQCKLKMFFSKRSDVEMPL